MQCCSIFDFSLTVGAVFGNLFAFRKCWPPVAHDICCTMRVSYFDFYFVASVFFWKSVLFNAGPVRELPLLLCGCGCVE